MTNNAPNWQIAHASHIGKSHIDANIPNQDKTFVYQDANISIAIVCDGAGSARFGDIGAAFFSQNIGQLLINFANHLLQKQQNQTADTQLFSPPQIDNYQQILLKNISTIRQNFQQQNPQQNQQQSTNSPFSLDDYHTTLTAITLFHTLDKALLIKIGDSPVLLSQFLLSNSDNEQKIDYFANIQLIDEQKTEYANETHFITQTDWQNHLEIQWLDSQKTDFIAVMSDGCGDLALQVDTSNAQGKSVYRPFLANLVFNVCHQPVEQHTALIEQSLGNPATYRLTGDDKSLILLIKNPEQYQQIEPFFDKAIFDNTLVNSETATVASNLATDNLNVLQSQKTPTNQLQSQSPTQPPSQPTATLPTLPTPQAISQTGKNRRYLGLGFGLVLLAGIGTLMWLNVDKLEQLRASYQAKTHTQTQNPAKTEQPTQTLPTVSLPSQAFNLTDTLKIVNMNADNAVYSISALLKINKQSININDLKNHLKADQNTDWQPLTITVLNPNTPPYTDNLSSIPNSQIDTQHNRIVQTASIGQQHTCQLIDDTPDNLNQLKTLLNQNDDMIKPFYFVSCQIRFSQLATQPPAPIVDKHVSIVQLSQGLRFLPLYRALTHTTSSSQTENDPAQGVFANTPNVQVHYLSNQQAIANLTNIAF